MHKCFIRSSCCPSYRAVQEFGYSQTCEIQPGLDQQTLSSLQGFSQKLKSVCPGGSRNVKEKDWCIFGEFLQKMARQTPFWLKGCRLIVVSVLRELTVS